jgi:L-alanine-DL-glutamate epimerase-like enolase superfamily enzyme
VGSTGIRIREVRLDIEDRTFDVPFGLSATTLATLPQATATVVVTDARGRQATGMSTGFLSTGWAFPTAAVDTERKDAAMREVATRLADVLGGVTEEADPLLLASILGAETDRVLREVARDHDLGSRIPRLAGAVCGSPLDLAVWDAWGRARGTASLDGLDGGVLCLDLAAYLGRGFEGRWPAEWLTAPRQQLLVQHVLGLADPLDGPEPEGDEPPGSLRAWVARDGVRRLKLKVSGSDPAADAARVADAHETTRRALGDVPPQEVRVALDPNEGCADTSPVHELLDRLEKDQPDVRAALDYVEQPTPRDEAVEDLRSLTERVPVVLDEGMGHLGDLAKVREEGWSGVAIKTGKGLSHSLLTYCWARSTDRHVVIQDLTNPGIGLVQSAAFARRLRLDSDAFECNSRQYVPSANVDAARRWPELFQAEAGKVDASRLDGPGLT